MSAVSGFAAAAQDGHLFYGTEAGVLVTDLRGAEVGYLDVPGVRDVTVSGGEVLVATATASNRVHVFDAGTLGRVATHVLPAEQCPVSVTGVGIDKIAYGYACDGQWGGVAVIGRAVTGVPRTTGFAGWSYNPIVRAVPGTSRFVVANRGISYASAGVVDASRADLQVLSDASLTGCSNLRDIAVSPDGLSATPACGSPYRHEERRLADWSVQRVFPATHYPVAAAYSADGSHFAGGTDSSYGDDVWLSTADATPRAVYSYDVTPSSGHATPVDRGIAFSHDGNELYVVSRDWSTQTTSLDVLRGRDVALPGAPVRTATTVNVPGTVLVGGEVVVSGRVTTYDGTSPAAGRVAVTATQDGTSTVLEAMADAEGRYAVRWLPRVPGIAQLTAAYAGTEGSAASNGYASTIVSKRASAVALTSTRRALSVTLTATLTGGHVNRTVVITANDVVIARKNLLATEKLIVSHKLRSATTTFEAKYAGDDWYDASHTKVTIAR